MLAAIVAANEGHQPSYGADVYTGSAAGGRGRAVRWRAGGAARLQRHRRQRRRPAVDGAALGCGHLRGGAHINIDENAAPERVAGLKLLPVETPDGKLTPELIDRQAWGFDDFHRAQPSVVSLTQSTEAGTVYTLEEMRAIADHAAALGIKVHVDGSRLSNAAASLGLLARRHHQRRRRRRPLLRRHQERPAVRRVRDRLRRSAADGLVRLRKMDMQLSSKMRFVSAQLIAVLTDDLWRRNASQANEMATLLRIRLEAAVVAGSIHAEFPRATEANELVRPGRPRRDRPAGRGLPVRDLGPVRRRGPVRLLVRHQASDIDALVAAWVLAERAVAG